MGSSGARVALRSVYLEGDFASIRRKIAIDLFVSGVKTPVVRCCVFLPERCGLPEKERRGCVSTKNWSKFQDFAWKRISGIL